MRNVCNLAIMFGMCLVSALRAENAVKLIDWSWSNPTIDYLENNLPRMKEECSFLNGLVLRISGDAEDVDGEQWTPQTGNSWGRKPWHFEAFQNAIERYKALDLGQFTDNFFYLTTSTIDFDWLNDDDCAVMTANFGVAAQVARQMGLKGLGVDIEEYGRRFWNFSDLKTDLPDDEVAAIVFRRGQDWGRAVFGAYPDVVLLMPFCLTMDAPLATAFMNGVIDVMPSTAIIYEGDESSSYAAKTPTDYSDMQHGLRRLISKLVKPENVNKARGQIRLAPAFYLDAYFSDNPESSFYVKSLEPGRSQYGPVKFLAHNLSGATLEADPYIWIYGEQACWWKNSSHPRAKRTWEEMPDGAGVVQAITDVISGAAGKSAAVPENLVKDPIFQGGGAWSLWQIEADRKQPIPGDGTVKNGRALVHKVTRGCFNQSVPVKPGQLYFFMCRGGVNDARGGKPRASVCFKNDGDKWLSRVSYVHLDIPQTGKEETVWTYFIAPAQAASASVQCGISEQLEGGEAFFTEILLEEK